MVSNSGSLKQIPAPNAGKQPLAAWLFLHARNIRHFHERIMARFLERRGWCVFYLEERARNCPDQGSYWLSLYEQGRKRLL